MTWIQTYTGGQFDPLNPRTEDVNIIDIAHALSMKCRYTGHAPQFYSVAQHSVLASMFCSDSRAALMHDGGEAYLPDVARPIKQYLPGFMEMEDAVLSVIFDAFKVKSLILPDCVHEIDLRLLASEWGWMGWPRLDWMESIERVPLNFVSWSPGMAKVLFLRRFLVLFPEYSDASILQEIHDTELQLRVVRTPRRERSRPLDRSLPGMLGKLFRRRVVADGRSLRA